jgi:osmotically-inducible protein OsmY
MKFSYLSALVFVAGIGTASAAYAAGSVNLNQPAVGPDKTITRMVQQQINDQMQQSDQVYVATTHNVVSLHGFVSSDSDKQRAQTIASSVMGVADVDNHLVVGRSAND